MDANADDVNVLQACTAEWGVMARSIVSATLRRSYNKSQLCGVFRERSRRRQRCSRNRDCWRGRHQLLNSKEYGNGFGKRSQSDSVRGSTGRALTLITRPERWND